jgi:hypothetical protein
MPGFFYAVITALIVGLMLIAPRRPRLLRNLAYLLSPAYNEVPLLFAYIMLASVVPAFFDGTQRDT